MTEPITRYFEQELAFVRRSLGQFGQDHPNHAQALNIHQGKIEDPSIARLLDGVALLNAGIEKQLADQLPEVTTGLLDILYPSYTQTVPSVAYLELDTDGEVPEAVRLEKGARFSASTAGGECFFQTVSDLEIAPFIVEDIRALSAPFPFNRPQEANLSGAVIQLSLSTGDPDVFFSHLELSDLDFFVQGFENNADSLVELLLSHTQAISVSEPECETHWSIPVTQLKNRISDLDFTFLPRKGNQFSGYQLISEFFFFKEKRQFFRMKGFGDAASQVQSSSLVVNLFMSSLPTEFIRLFDADVFKLNLVPAINLFEQTGEPVNYDQRRLTVPVYADSHSDSEIEIVEVQDVYEITSQGNKPLVPLYRNKYQSRFAHDFWQSKKDVNGDFHLAVTLGDSETGEYSKVYGTRLLCTNGKQACAVNQALECLENIDLAGEFLPIYSPSAPIIADADQHLHWQFIGLLNCNFSSLLHSPEPVETLKQMLRLCSRGQVSSEDIKTIRDVTFRTQVAAIRITGKNVFSPGTEVTITLDTSGPYHVFSDVLNRFFQQFCSFDRYIQVNIQVYGRDGVVKKYNKVHGSQLCL